MQKVAHWHCMHCIICKLQCWPYQLWLGTVGLRRCLATNTCPPISTVLSLNPITSAIHLIFLPFSRELFIFWWFVTMCNVIRSTFDEVLPQIQDDISNSVFVGEANVCMPLPWHCHWCWSSNSSWSEFEVDHTAGGYTPPPAQGQQKVSKSCSLRVFLFNIINNNKQYRPKG